jgi:sugar/nucleoside kinase (ribokinase family)
MTAIGALGEDVWGQQVAEIIRAEGVNLTGVRHAGTTTQVIVLVSQTGDHVFLGKYGHGRKMNLTQGDVTLIKKSGAVFFAGYTLCETRLVDLTLAAVQAAQQQGIPVFFDPGPQITAVSPAMRQQALALTDTLLLTEEELPLLTDGGLPGLAQQGPKQVVLKRGVAGCAIWTPAQAAGDFLVEAEGYPVEVVDTAAAGDSFAAGFIAASLWGWSLADCAKFGNAVGAAKVKKLGGGRNVPTLDEVRAVINSFDLGLEV